MVLAAPARTAYFSSAATRGRLAGIEELCPGSGNRVHEAPGQGRDAAQPLEEVQGGSLEPQDLRGRSRREEGTVPGNRVPITDRSREPYARRRPSKKSWPQGARTRPPPRDHEGRLETGLHCARPRSPVRPAVRRVRRVEERFRRNVSPGKVFRERLLDEPSGLLSSRSPKDGGGGATEAVMGRFGEAMIVLGARRGGGEGLWLWMTRNADVALGSLRR